MTVAVTGLGWISALGLTAADHWQRLLAGQGAIALAQPFLDTHPRPLALLGKSPAPLDGLLTQGAIAALTDAGVPWPDPAMGLVIGSSRGYQGALEQWRQTGQGDWLALLPGAIAAPVARLLGSRGPVLCPMAACSTGLWAIAQGADLIRRGQCDRVLVGTAESPITPLTLAGFERMGALATTGCYPFDLEREGLALGEGSAFLVLESLAQAQQRQARCYGYVQGAGFTADAHHPTAPHFPSGSGLQAIQQSLQASGLAPAAIGFIHAHGTGTPRNDAHETALIQALFPPTIPVSTTKGATGHTLGASGAMGAIAALLALSHQVLPPCIGLRHPAFPLNLVRQATAADLTAALVLSFGFGGQNAALTLSRHPTP